MITPLMPSVGYLPCDLVEDDVESSEDVTDSAILLEVQEFAAEFSSWACLMGPAIGSEIFRSSLQIQNSRSTLPDVGHEKIIVQRIGKRGWKDTFRPSNTL